MPECTQEELELHVRFVQKPLMMGAQTVDASAVWRYALSMVVQSKNVCALLHQPEYQATAWRPEDLFHDRQPCSSWHRIISRVVKRGTSFVTHSAAASAGNATHATRSAIISTKTGKRASQYLRFPTSRKVKGAKNHSRWRPQSNMRCTIREHVE